MGTDGSDIDTAGTEGVVDTSSGQGPSDSVDTTSSQQVEEEEEKKKMTVDGVAPDPPEIKTKGVTATAEKTIGTGPQQQPKADSTSAPAPAGTETSTAAQEEKKETPPPTGTETSTAAQEEKKETPPPTGTETSAPAGADTSTAAKEEKKETPPPTSTEAPPPPPTEKTEKPAADQPEKSAFEVFRGLDTDDKKNILSGILAQGQALSAAGAAYGRGGTAYQGLQESGKNGLFHRAFMSRVNASMNDPDKAVAADELAKGYFKTLTGYIRAYDQQLTDIQLVKDGSMSREEYWGKYRSRENWDRPLEADIALVQQMKSRATALSANLVGVAVDTRMPADQMDMVVAKQASVNMPFQKIREQADAYKKGVEERFEKNVTANYEKNYLLAQQRSAQVIAGRTGDLMGDMEHRLDEMRKERESSKKPKEKSPQEKSLEELHRATKGFTDLAGVDTSKMSKEELVKYDFALSQAAKSMEQAAKDYSQIAAGGRFRRKQDPMAQVANQIEAAAGYTSKMTREERARLRSGYASDRRRMEQAVAQRTQDMRMNYMRQAGMLPAAPAQQMRQAPQQMQAQYMQAQTAYRQTTMQYQGAQATVQSLQMQMLQAQRNLMAAEMARYQARMAYLDVQIQMAQMGMAPQQMGMAPQQMGMGPQQMGMGPQPMGMGPQPMGMMPQQFGGSPYVQQAQAIRPTFGPQGMTMGPGWLPYGVQLQPATPTATPKAAPTSSQPTEPDLPTQEEVEAASKKAVESEKPSPPSKESVEHTIDKSLLTPEDQKGLFTDLELKGGLPAEKMAEIGKIRRQARKEGIDLNAPVDESLIPDWAKKEGATAAEAEMGKLAAHREANRLAKQKAAAAEAKPQTRERSTVNTAHPPKPTGLETAKPQTPQTRERSTVNTVHPPKPTGLEAAKSQAKQKKTPEKQKEEGQKKWREARKASQQERKADGPKIGVHK